MLNSLSATDVALLLAAFFLLRPYLDRFTSPPQPVTSSPPPPVLELTALNDLVTRVVTLETKVEGLPSLWATERARVEEQTRLQKRAAASIAESERRAEKRSAGGSEEPELFDGPVHPALHGINGAGSGSGVVPTLRTDLAAAAGWVAPHKVR